MRTSRIRSLALLVALAFVAAPATLHAQKKSRDVITRDEILKSAQKDGDLFTAIKVLRPHFLEMPRGIRSMGGTYGTAPLAVIVDKIRQPGTDVLALMPANSVEDVKYLDPSRSQNEFGITANGGALIIRKYTAVSTVDSLNANKKPPQ